MNRMLFGGVVAVAALFGGWRAWADGPAAGTFVPTGSLTDGGRDTHAAVLLGDGHVLVVGGNQPDHVYAHALAEMYDPATGVWSLAGTMATPRLQLTANLLPDGRVLVTGGQEGTAVYASTELWDPATHAFTPGPAMSVARELHRSVTLADGRILVAGGTSGSSGAYPLDSAEIYDPASGAWSATGSMTTSRNVFGMVLLPDHRVLVAGGSQGADHGYASIADCEVWDPATGTWSTVPSMSARREYPAIAVLHDGRVIVAGGSDGAVSLHSAEIFDPATDSWSSMTGTLTAGGHTMTLTVLADGRVLAAGGYDYAVGAVESGADLIDPVAGVITPLPAMNAPRYQHSATLLGDETVLLAGGASSLAVLPYAGASCELFGFGTLPPPDTTPPVIAAAADVNAKATSTLGAVVTFATPTATDAVDGAVAVTCVPASGTLFEVGVTTVTCTAHDTHGNTATSTFDVIVTIDPFYLKGQVAEQLNSLLASSDKKTVKKLLKAIGDIQDGLAPALWTDDTHLSALGRTTFKEDSVAVGQLLDILSPNAIVLQAIASLVDADKALAETAIADARAANPTSTHLVTADAEMVSAAASAAAGAPQDAIRHYRRAWKAAMKALGLL